MHARRGSNERSGATSRRRPFELRFPRQARAAVLSARRIRRTPVRLRPQRVTVEAPSARRGDGAVDRCAPNNSFRRSHDLERPAVRDQSADQSRYDRSRAIPHVADRGQSCGARVHDGWWFSFVDPTSKTSLRKIRSDYLESLDVEIEDDDDDDET